MALRLLPTCAAAPPLPRRALLLAAPLLLFAPPASAVLPGFPADKNSSIVRQLQSLERRKSAIRGSAEVRLAAALGQLQRSRALAARGSVLEARGILREGGMKSLRVDAAVFVKEVPEWSTELLDGYDGALKALGAEQAGGVEDGAAATRVEAVGRAFESALRGVVAAAEAAARLRVASSDEGVEEQERLVEEEERSR